LKKLSISTNDSFELRELFAELIGRGYADVVQSLSIQGGIKELPDSIGEFSQLTWLELCKNELTWLPDSVRNLKNLTWFGINKNQFEFVPEVLADLTNLTHLYLCNIPITTLPEFLLDLKNLEFLALNGDPFLSLPEFMVDLDSLKCLCIENSQLTSLPEFLGYLTNLTSLNINHNKLNTLPDSFRNLTNLRRLDMSYNQFKALPDSLEYLKKLRCLNFRSNQITSLPEFIGDLSNLEYLWIQDNELSTLPHSFGNLKKLRYCDSWNNKFPSIPVSSYHWPKSVLNAFHIKPHELSKLRREVARLIQVMEILAALVYRNENSERVHKGFFVPDICLHILKFTDETPMLIENPKRTADLFREVKAKFFNTGDKKLSSAKYVSKRRVGNILKLSVIALFFAKWAFSGESYPQIGGTLFMGGLLLACVWGNKYYISKSNCALNELREDYNKRKYHFI